MIFDVSSLAQILGVVGLVILSAAAVQGLVERAGLPLVAMFLALGALLGPYWLGVANFPMESAALAGVTIISLILVLFSDSVTVTVRELRQHAGIAAVVLGPGTLVAAFLNAAAAHLLLGLSLPASAILGAALASTDPVMVRTLLRNPRVPAAARIALRLESGLNDAVVLPIVLLATALLARPGAVGSKLPWDVAGRVLVLGPLAGIVVGYAAVRLLAAVRDRFGMRRDYEALYVLGVAFSAYAAAEAVDASGFMAAFSAGLTIATLDVELCDCFMEYGETTSEMFLLFAFVALGTSLVWTAFDVISWRTIAFGLVAVAGRSIVLGIALLRAKLTPLSRAAILLYGPRGLNSLLLILLPVFAGVGEARDLFPVAALAVLLSLAIHGVVHRVLIARMRTGEESTVLAVPSAMSSPPAIRSEEDLKIGVDDLARLRAGGQPVVVLDVRQPAAYSSSTTRAAGAIRMEPNGVVESAAALALPRNAWLLAYCT